MISPYCPSKEAEVPEVMGTLALVIIRPRAGESRSSRDFTNKLMTLGSLSPLIFLALLTISEIEFPWSLHLADFFGGGFQPLFLSFLAKIIFCLTRQRIFLGEALALAFLFRGRLRFCPLWASLALPYRRGYPLPFSRHQCLSSSRAFCLV